MRCLLEWVADWNWVGIITLLGVILQFVSGRYIHKNPVPHVDAYSTWFKDPEEEKLTRRNVKYAWKAFTIGSMLIALAAVMQILA